MASRGTSSTGLGEQKKKSSPITVPTEQRRRTASKDRTRTKTTAEKALPNPPPTGQTHNLGRGFPGDEKTPPSFGGRTRRTPPSDGESSRRNKSPSIHSDDGNYSDNVFHMSDLENNLPAQSPPKATDSSKAVEPTPAAKKSSGDRDSSRRGPSKERTRDGKKANRGPAKAGGSR
ncbi:hypothetical protein BTUL_0210g00220 [Botrytis tulipae]|uniref:Uncharacterized protein n=1 Tax=Botrytis tulipae TaxID=87230 RepID=A0A4Z1EB57_9HELO|nr:hypothetical protein BTUL_0210g00220 [Botrytis tulipae]